MTAAANGHAHDEIPEAEVQMTPNTGGLEGDWFYEEDQRRSRFGIRVTGHLHSEQTPFQKIDVYHSEFHGHFLTLDDLMMVTERDEFVYHEMIVHVPLCAMPQPRSVLIIGGGDCGCIREALKHPCIERVVQCEIDERVTRVSEKYFPWVQDTIADPRVELVFDDGVKYIDANVASFDLVIIDSTDPIGPAVGLFQSEFYAKVARCLKPGGVMCAQAEPPMWAGDAVVAIHQQMRKAFAVVEPYWGAIPTYPSGSWSWAWASQSRRPSDYFDDERGRLVEQTTKYWHRGLQRGCFEVPNFLRKALAAGLD